MANQAVLQIFCSHCPLSVKCLSLKREIIQSNVYKLLPKINQIIYTLGTNSMPNIMIIAQGVIQVLYGQNA